MDDSQTTPLIGRYIGLVQARDEDATFETGEIPDEFPKHGFWIKPRVLSDICTDSRVVPPGGLWACGCCVLIRDRGAGNHISKRQLQRTGLYCVDE